MTTIDTMTCMAKRQRATLFDQIRQAVLDSDDTRYRICQQTGIDKASLSRFVHGERGLSEDAMNCLGDYLRLEIIVRKQRKGKK